jgi:hypothetical protein
MDSEEVGYRSPIDNTPVTVPDEDSDNFSTLVDVYRKFKQEIKDLEHTNSFDVLKLEDEGKAVKILLRQIAAKQEAYRIVMPLFLQLESAVQDVKKANEGGN